MRNAKKQLKQKTSLSFVLILLALVCAFALSGCGGGGGGGGANMGGQPAQMPTPMPGGGGGMTGGGSMDPPATIPTREQALEDQTTATNAVSVIARAAQAQPNPGSVTQSSNVDSNNTTTDQVEVTAEHGTGVPRFSLRNGSEWSLGMNEGNPLQISDAPSPWKGVSLRERINAGVLYIDVYTDITAPETQQGGGPDTDYLVGGIWLFVPGDASSVADYAFGAFSDGSDPFRQNNLTALQGTARYEGNAIGVATDTTDEVPVNTIGGDVVLTADFGGAGALGTIGGSITNLYDDEPLTGSLNLGAANIGSSHNGFFIGEVSGSVESRSYTGNWSGQFFGNGESGGMPGSVAGTLSGGSTDGIVNFVGAYGAHRPSSSPMSGGRNILVDALEADASASGRRGHPHTAGGEIEKDFRDLPGNRPHHTIVLLLRWPDQRQNSLHHGIRCERGFALHPHTQIGGQHLLVQRQHERCRRTRREVFRLARGGLERRGRQKRDRRSRCLYGRLLRHPGQC